MKIGFFTDCYLPQPNGVATSVEACGNALMARGHQVYVVAPNYPKYKDKEHVIRLPSIKIHRELNLRLATHLPGKAIFSLSKIDFDIIHGHAGGTITLLGWELAKLQKIPFVFTYHTLWNRYTHYFLKGKIISPTMMEKASRIFCNRCDCVIVPMPKIKDELISYGVKKPIAVILSGVDLAKFGRSQMGFLLKKTGLGKGKILLYVGRLGKEKSVDFLLRAFQLIHHKDHQANLVLVGDGPEKTNLEQLSQKLNIERNVHFAGLISQEEISKVYADATIFVFASQTETQGMVILEALASGVPVVAVKDAVYDGIIEDRVNGVLAENYPEQFAKACLHLLNNASYRTRLSEQALNTAQKFSVERTAESLDQLYKKLIALTGNRS